MMVDVKCLHGCAGRNLDPINRTRLSEINGLPRTRRDRCGGDSDPIVS
jgi:hypothetical protein